jgi:anaerobic selenocysteine-containing dehydrogenase
MLPTEQRQKKLGNNLFRLQNFESYEKLSRYTQLHGKRLPARYLTSGHPYLAWQAMITGKPYPIRALIVMAGNPMLTQANTRMVYQALKSLDLLVVLDEFITPTAMLADYILPAAGSLEHSMIQTNGGVFNVAYGGPGAVPPLFERQPDYFFWYNLGVRCGQSQYWPWETLEIAYDHSFTPAGLNWPEFCQTGFYYKPPCYQKYESEGFATPSGKVELYSSLLEELGYNPLPEYMRINNKSSDYPLDLITGVRHQPYYATEFRQIKKLRRVRPEPIVEMDATTAFQLNLNAGECVWVETSEGRIKHTLQLAKMRPGMVAIEYGWWFPELPAKEPSLGGVWKSNANLLTRADIDGCDPILGQWSYRTLHCRVYKADDQGEI